MENISSFDTLRISSFIREDKTYSKDDVVMFSIIRWCSVKEAEDIFKNYVNYYDYNKLLERITKGFNKVIELHINK